MRAVGGLTSSSGGRYVAGALGAGGACELIAGGIRDLGAKVSRNG
jgi:hypothetical protein